MSNWTEEEARAECKRRGWTIEYTDGGKAQLEEDDRSLEACSRLAEQLYEEVHALSVDLSKVARWRVRNAATLLRWVIYNLQDPDDQEAKEVIDRLSGKLKVRS